MFPLIQEINFQHIYWYTINFVK